MTEATESSPELIADFVDEALESLRPLPSMFESFRASPDNYDPIHAVFRAVHSVKGCAGFLGLVAVKQLAHALENTLDEVRKGNILLSDDLQRAFVNGFDALDGLLQRASQGTIDAELSEEDSALLEVVQNAAAASRCEREPEAQLLAELNELAAEIAATAHPESAAWSVRVRDMVVSITGQEEDGENESETSVAVKRRSAKSFIGVACRLGDADVGDSVEELLTLFVRAEDGVHDEAEGRAFLERARCFADSCEQAGQRALADIVRQAAADYQMLVDSPLDIDAMLVSIAWDRLEPALAQLLVETPSVAAEGVKDEKGDAAAAATARAEAAARNKARMIRIREECVDDFLESVSGLFLTGELYKDVQSRMTGNVGTMANLVEELRQINNAFAAQSTTLQRNVVALRQVAAAGLLSKLPQMARSLAGQLGKRIDVHIAGQETEIDKSLVEDLDAPMTHMIRNVVDHALETPEQRIEAGKSEAGNLWIKVEQTKSHVLVTIADDGRGIDPAILRAKAVEKGAITADVAKSLTDQQAVELIFHAGFSTAKQVSDISGRGVGMDVVRTKIREYNGDVQVESKVGQGTTFRLTIPIREAVVVVDGLLLRHAGGHYVLPFENVLELAELGSDDVKSVQGAHVASLRGETYDAVTLSKLLDLPTQAVETTADDKTVGVLVGCKQGSFCLLVDSVLGHRKVVVNSIKEMLPAADRLAGVAQLGGGRLALVLSVQDIFDARLRNARAGTLA